MFPNPPRQEGFLNDNRGPIGPVRGVLRSPLQCVYLVASFQVWRIKAARLSGSLAEISHPDHRDELLVAAKQLSRIG